MGHVGYVKLPSSFWPMADRVVAGLLLAAMAFWAPNGILRTLFLVQGGLWLGLSKLLGLSLALPSFLLLLALRMPLPDGMGVEARLCVIPLLGTASWALAFWRVRRWSALLSGLLWSLIAVLMPALAPLVLSGYPRLGRTQGDHAGLSRWPGLMLLAAALGSAAFLGKLPSEWARVATPEHYASWGQALAALFLTPHVWEVIPVAGVFEIAQTQPGDIRTTWRNLLAMGMLACIPFLSPHEGLPLFYLAALPLSAVLLTRWTLALPGWPSRAGLWAGLLLYSLPFLRGGQA